MRIRNRLLACGFASPELFAVLSGFALLALVGAPITGRNRLRSEQAVCSNHLRKLGQAAIHYAHDNAGRFPTMNNAFWPWDMPVSTANRLIEYGATRRDFYCPSVTLPNRDDRWRFTSGSTNDIATTEAGFRLAGYQFAFAEAGRVLVTNVTESLTPKAWNINGVLVNPPLAERVIAADAILSLAGNEQDRSTNTYVGIAGAFTGHDSAHLAGPMPAGGNLLMADGHVDWRRFSKMRVRTVSSPSFWW